MLSVSYQLIMLAAMYLDIEPYVFNFLVDSLNSPTLWPIPESN
jgi:hypothetical protein